MTEVDRSGLVLAANLAGDDQTDTRLLREMHARARTFLANFGWCKEIRAISFGLGVGGIVAVFLCDIVPAAEDVDETMWIVVGDLPSAVIIVDDSPDAESALTTYLAEMRAWVAAVRSGDATALEDCLPVNVAPTEEWAARLESRMNSLQELFLSTSPL